MDIVMISDEAQTITLPEFEPVVEEDNAEYVREIEAALAAEDALYGIEVDVPPIDLPDYTPPTLHRKPFIIGVFDAPAT